MEHNHLGYNFRMTDIQGAFGCVQLDRAQWLLQERSRRASNCDDILADLEWLDTPCLPEGYTHDYQAYVCLFKPDEPDMNNVTRLHEERDSLMMSLEDKGIATRQGTHSPILQGFYAEKYDLRSEQFPNSYIADRLSRALPLYPQMTEDEHSFVRVYEKL